MIGVPPYIIVEGTIGVGKTTLSRRLADCLGARTLLESFDENPFLADFYDDQRRYAFHTEMYFLIERFNQQKLFAQGDLLHKHTVSDYVFSKCRLFAAQTLTEDELGLFDRVYNALAPQVPEPDIVVYLHAPVPVLLKRIQDRGREYEQSIDPDYLRTLNSSYAELFAGGLGGRLVSVDTTTIDTRTAPFARSLLDWISRGGRGVYDPVQTADL